MPRTPARVLAAVCLLAAAALAAGQSNLKDFRLEAKQPNDPSNRIGQLREGKLRVSGPDLKSNQTLLRDVARFHVFKATDDKYYLPPETGDLRPRDTPSTFDQVLLDIGGQLLTPGPDAPKYTPEQAEYSREFGVALTDAVREVLKTNPPAPMRVNAGRLLALGARSGAGAFAPTIHELLTDSFPLDKGKPAKTPPELLLYAIDAAGNLFAAYDPVWHLNTDWRSQFRHSFDNKDQVTLARDLLALLEKGTGMGDLAAPGSPDQAVKRRVLPDGTVPPAGGSVPAAKLEASGPTPEQAHVTAYYRRHVVDAVSKIRPDLVGEVGQPPLRPGLVIARLAVGEGRYGPPPTTPEVAEAVLGLCYLSPSQNLNVPEVLGALAAGCQFLARDFDTRETAAVARTAKLVPWRVYAARLSAALDHLTRQAGQNPRWRDHRAAVGQVVAAVREDLIPAFSRPEDQTLKAATGSRLGDLVKERRGQPAAARSLYTDDPSFVLAPRAGQ